MLSKIAKTILQIKPSRQLGSSSYRFCSQKQNQENQEQQEQTKGRNTEADQENEDLQSKKEKIDYGWQAWRLFVWGNISLVSYNLYLLTNKEKPDEELGAIDFYMGIAKKMHNKYTETIDFFTKPVVKELLPEIPFLPPGMDHPKTVALNLSGTLIKSNFVFGKGTEVLKRPGLSKFLRTLQQLGYEVVIFTNDDTMFSMELSAQLDPSQSILSGRFGRESMVYEGGQYIKDLRYLNRDLSKVIIIEKDPSVVKYHSDNAIFLSEFEGDSEDNELSKVLPFLQHLARPDIKDVRKEIGYYGNHNPSDKFLEELKVKQQQIEKKTSSGLTGFIRSQGSGAQRQPSYGTGFGGQRL